MKSLPIGLACLVALAGCQTMPDQLPRAEPAPAPACHFSADSAFGDALFRQSVALLERWEYRLDTTDATLGLVSASKERELIGYYDPYDSYYGYGAGSSMRLFGGVGIGRRSSVGLGVGFGGGIGQRPVESERVSVLVSDDEVRLARDIRRFDHLGDLRESRSASDDDFCRRFQSALPAIASGDRP